MIMDFSVPLIDFINIKFNEKLNSYKTLNHRGLNPLFLMVHLPIFQERWRCLPYGWSLGKIANSYSKLIALIFRLMLVNCIHV